MDQWVTYSPLHGTRKKEPEPFLTVTNLSRRFGQTPAIEDVSFTLGRGQVLGIIGRSGAGKSTLIRCLNGLERPDSGEVEIDGRKITALSESELQAVGDRLAARFDHR